jgi:hypothetical protein
MRLQGLVFSTALMSLAVFTTKAAPPLALIDESCFEPKEVSRSSAGRRSVSPPIPSSLISEDKVLGLAYYDTLNILSTENECSEFFGGAGNAVDIFNMQMSKVRKRFWPVAVGIRMSGQTTNVVNIRTKREYRLFDTVEINTNGPFYRKKFSAAEARVPRIGRFEPNTKEARVLMLLHELGHIVKGTDGNWLLPNDGQADEQSRDNSLKIEGVCGEEIRNLGKTDYKAAAAQLKPRSDDTLQTPGIQP